MVDRSLAPALGGLAAARRLAWRARCALEAHALPLAQAPQVPLDLARIDLAAGQVEVRARDQALLVALEGHPLGQDIVGVREAHRPVGPRLVGELDAVLVEQ